MENLTYQTYLTDPAARTRIADAARSARAAAGYRYLVLPLVQFCGRLVAVRGVRLHLDPRETAA